MKCFNFLINDLSGGGAERVLSILSSELAEKGVVRIFLLNDVIVQDIDNRINIVKLSVTPISFINFLLAPFLLIYYSYFLKFQSFKVIYSNLTISMHCQKF